MREFSPGDLVLVLLLTSANRLEGLDDEERAEIILWERNNIDPLRLNNALFSQQIKNLQGLL